MAANFSVTNSSVTVTNIRVQRNVTISLKVRRSEKKSITVQGGCLANSISFDWQLLHDYGVIKETQ